MNKEIKTVRRSLIERSVIATNLQGIAGIVMIAMANFALGLFLGALGFISSAQIYAGVLVGALFVIAVGRYRLGDKPGSIVGKIPRRVD